MFGDPKGGRDSYTIYECRLCEMLACDNCLIPVNSATENYLMPIVAFPVISILIAFYRVATHPVTKLYYSLHKDTITSRLRVFLSYIAIMLAILGSYSNNFSSCDAPRA
jgi:hypothetical protein